MKFKTSRENLLMPLQQVVGVIEKRQTLPILSNVLIQLADNRLEFTGTDLEVQLVTHSVADSGEDGEITVPARKLLDICRLLPDGSLVNVECRPDKVTVHSGRSRFSLSTLPADNYPAFDISAPEAELTLSSKLLKKAMEKTLFAMALQDVRYYLNGLLLDLDGRLLRAVASDGHRLALFEEMLEDVEFEPRQVIVPRKGIMELYRLLSDLHFQIGSGKFQAVARKLDQHIGQNGQGLPFFYHPHHLLQGHQKIFSGGFEFHLNRLLKGVSWKVYALSWNSLLGIYCRFPSIPQPYGWHATPWCGPVPRTSGRFRASCGWSGLWLRPWPSA